MLPSVIKLNRVNPGEMPTQASACLNAKNELATLPQKWLENGRKIAPFKKKIPSSENSCQNITAVFFRVVFGCVFAIHRTGFVKQSLKT